MTGFHANITKLYAFSTLQKTLFPMAIITLFWKDQIGLTLTEILLLQAIFSAATVVLEYPSGYLGDRLGYRNTLTIASILGVAGWGVYTIADSFTTVLVAEVLLGAALSFISGSDSALLYESLRAEGLEWLYARCEGRMNGFAQTGEAAGALFAGVLYASVPLLPFILQVVLWIMAFSITRTMHEPPRDKALFARTHLAEALRITRYAFVENRRLRAAILLNTFLGLASFYPVWLIQPYMQEHSVPLSWFGPIWTGANLTVAVFALLSHRAHASLGDRNMILLCITLVLAGYLGLGVIGGTFGFLFYYLLTGMRGLRGPMFLNHIQVESPSANRASILSLQSLAFRIAFIITGPLVGRLADQVTVQQTFHFLLYGYLVLLPPLSWLFLRNAGQRKSE